MNKRFSAFMRFSVGLLAVCLGTSFSACHRPVATFQRSARPSFYTPPPNAVAEPSETASSLPADVPERPAPAPVGYASARPGYVPEPLGQRIRLHQPRSGPPVTPSRPPAAPATTAPNHVPAAIQPGPGPKDKQRKTLREILGLPPRKKLNWWQRIPWQLKAAVVVVLVAVTFAILHITVLAIVFGLIGAFLLIRGLKKSFKVRRGLFGIGG